MSERLTPDWNRRAQLALVRGSAASSATCARALPRPRAFRPRFAGPLLATLKWQFQSELILRI